jgi:hypothetical protein
MIESFVMTDLRIVPVVQMARQIYLGVWSGFLDPSQTDDIYNRLLYGHPEHLVTYLRTAICMLIYVEFARKQSAELEWPAITDCDRLDEAFAALERRKVLGLHNAGYSMSAAHGEAYFELQVRSHVDYVGYCFYHEQDIDTSIESGDLYIGFDDTQEGSPMMEDVARIVVEELAAAGLDPVWDGDRNARIHLKGFIWQRRTPNISSATPPNVFCN